MPPLPKAKPASKKPPSRARKPTTKAKAANELDASEEDLPAAITSTKKKMLTKSKATHKKKAVLEISDSEGQARGDDDAGDDDKVEWVIFHDYLGYKFETSTRSWKDIDLNWSLIMILEEDQVIRQGLFPVPGANISLSQGGKLYSHLCKHWQTRPPGSVKSKTVSRGEEDYSRLLVVSLLHSNLD
jgi:hypothetical protein